MRLLNTTTLAFEEFYGSRVPHYAILSHVWTEAELTHETFRTTPHGSTGDYLKITKLCEIARAGLGGWFFPLRYVWIDTICIDKRSSAELSESINKMHAYYERAEVCFVFLPDVDPVRLDSDASNVPHIEGVRQVDDFAPFLEGQFVHSRWFERGWTLQELLAPEKLLFFNSRYEALGGRIQYDSSETARMATFTLVRGVPHSIRNGETISDLVTKATGISGDVLTYGIKLAQPCIAKRMSWAAHRITTREEDVAYCLLGIFDVNMPLLYGEGAIKAFHRLQTKILANSTDESIFAWKQVDPSQAWSGLLAPSPKAFAGCQNMLELPYDTAPETHNLQSSYVKTKEGIELVLSLPRGLIPLDERRWIHPLRCGYLIDKRTIRRCCLRVRTKTRLPGRSADAAQTAQRWKASIFYLDGANEYQALKQALGWGRPHLIAESFNLNAKYREGLLHDLSSALSAYSSFLQTAHLTWREWRPTLGADSYAIRILFPYYTIRSEPYMGALFTEDRHAENNSTRRRFATDFPANRAD